MIPTLEDLTNYSRLSVSHDEATLDSLIETARDLSEQIRNLANLTATRKDTDLAPKFAAQLKLLTKTLGLVTIGAIRAGEAVVVGGDTNDDGLVAANKQLMSAVGDILSQVRVLNPTINACKGAAKVAQDASQKLDEAIMSLMANSNFPHDDPKKPVADYQTDMVTAAKVQYDLDFRLTYPQTLAQKSSYITAEACRNHYAETAKGIKDLEKEIASFAGLAALMASLRDDDNSKMALLEMSKNLADSLVNLING